MSERGRKRIVWLGVLLFWLMPSRGLADQVGGLSDPTQPTGWSASHDSSLQIQPQPVGNLRLQGTFSVGGRKSAMLSGRRVAVGDQVAGATVLAIEHRKVLLRVNDEVVVLAATMPDVKSPARTAGER